MKDITSHINAAVGEYFKAGGDIKHFLDAVKRGVYFEALKRCYGNSTKASELIGTVDLTVMSFKKHYCPDVEWPRDPNKSPPDPGVRLQNHKPLSDEDFAPTKVRD